MSKEVDRMQADAEESEATAVSAEAAAQEAKRAKTRGRVVRRAEAKACTEM
jgi:hypothetical protein